MPTFNLKHASFTSGCMDVFPLVIAVMPWGVLCGAMAIEAGLTPLQAQAMSLFIFGGAVQLAGLGLMGTQAGLMSIFTTSAVISSRHLLYSATYRQFLLNQPTHVRWFTAFLLTDEMFALTMTRFKSAQAFDLSYSLTTGFVFYLGWNISSLLGIVLGSTLPDLTALGLEFIVACMFIALVIPQIQSLAVLVCVVVSAVFSTLLTSLGNEHSLMISGLMGMVSGYVFSQVMDKFKEISA